MRDLLGEVSSGHPGGDLGQLQDRTGEYPGKHDRQQDGQGDAAQGHQGDKKLRSGYPPKDLLFIAARHDNPVPIPKILILVDLHPGGLFPPALRWPRGSGSFPLRSLQAAGPGRAISRMYSNPLESLAPKDILPFLGRVNHQVPRTVHDVGISGLTDLDGLDGLFQGEGALFRDPHVKRADHFVISIPDRLVGGNVPVVRPQRPARGTSLPEGWFWLPRWMAENRSPLPGFHWRAAHWWRSATVGPLQYVGKPCRFPQPASGPCPRWCNLW